MSAKGEDRADGFAAESLKGTGAKPSQSGGLHAEAGDGVASNRSLTGGGSRESARDSEASGPPRLPHHEQEESETAPGTPQEQQQENER